MTTSINFLKPDIALSRAFNIEYKDLIKAKGCYRNIFDIVQKNFRDNSFRDNVKVAYGYCTVGDGVENVFIRHAYLIDVETGLVIDPTFGHMKNLKKGIYVNFLCLSVNDYYKVVINDENLGLNSTSLHVENKLIQDMYKHGYVCIG